MKRTILAILFALSATAISARVEQRLNIISQYDSLPISILIIEPDSAPKGIVQLVHGMSEHKERYVPLMNFLADNGYVSIIHDHRGHGNSVHSADDLGYFYSGGYKALVEDTHAVTSLIRNRYPTLPTTLLGHSMGSMVVRAYTKSYDADIDALVVCGSPSYNSGSRIGQKIAARTAKKRGDKYRSAKIQNLAFGAFNRKFDGAGSPSAWICSDPEVVALYDADPKSNFIFTANGFENLFALMQEAYSRSGWSMHNPALPILFISGEDDPCAISAGKFEKAVDNMRKVGYTDLSSKLYPAMRHEILNERGKRQVWEELLEWIESRTQEQTK